MTDYLHEKPAGYRRGSQTYLNYSRKASSFLSLSPTLNNEIELNVATKYFHLQSVKLISGTLFFNQFSWRFPTSQNVLRRIMSTVWLFSCYISIITYSRLHKQALLFNFACHQEDFATHSTRNHNILERCKQLLLLSAPIFFKAFWKCSPMCFCFNRVNRFFSRYVTWNCD